MPRSTNLRLALALVSVTLAVSHGRAQAPDRPQSSEPAILRSLPQLPEQPRSLLEPLSPPGPPPAPLPGPYFELDPRLDPPEWPQPGWFADVDLSALGPHFKNRLHGTVQIGNRPPDTVHVPGADLDWAFSPRFEVGYRLSSGFGAFGLSYRFLATQGTAIGPSPDGPATLKSRLDFHVIDLDYISREWPVWPHWDTCKMQWRFGLRWASIYYDANSTEPFGEAAAGSGIFSARSTDRFVGFGPHVGVELARLLQWQGFSVGGRIDGWISLGRIRQGFFEESTMLGASGLPLGGVSQVSSSQAVPALNTQAGVSYQPPGYPDLEFFIGYQYEYWWNVGRLSITPNSRGELSDQGVLFRAAFNY
jgi:hypothetical protein